MIGSKTVFISKSKANPIDTPNVGTFLPGLSKTLQLKKPSDSNLSPFINSNRKTIQYWETFSESTHTDDPRWSPGYCPYICNYEGRFHIRKSKRSCSDPNYTREAKNRKIIARKKGEAYKRRREMQHLKELEKFKEKKKSKINFGITTIPSCVGLKGGAPTKKMKLNGYGSNDELKLINRGSDCFVNSTIQLLRKTGYVNFINTHFPTILMNSNPDGYKLCKLLKSLYGEDSLGKTMSVAAIRTYVAQMSGKKYLDDGSQQDAEEFFRALDGVLFEELVESEDFRKTRDLHWGREEMTMKFVDSPSSGACQTCGKHPISSETPFLFLKIKNIPQATGITLSALIQANFSESTKLVNMRCSICCESQNHRVQCPEIGVCRRRKAVEVCKITQYPTYLFVQLVRNIGNEPKVTTFIRIESELVLPNHQSYEVVGTIDHIGSSPVSGHYVTFVKQSSGKWRIFDDERSELCTFKQANTRNNYLLLFKKKSELSETVGNDIDKNQEYMQTECEVAENGILTSSKNVHNSHEGITETATNSADNVCVNIWQNNFSKPIQNHAMDKPKRNVDEPVEQNKTGITKRKKIKEMNEDEKRQYNREQYRKRRENLSENDRSIQRQNRKEEKAKQRAKERQQNEEEYLQKRRNEIAEYREQKRQENEEEYLQKRSKEIAGYRGQKRQENEDEYIQKLRDEKADYRGQKRKENEEEYLQKRSKEIAGYREKKREIRSKTRESRQEQFRESIRDGRIYECLCCHRLWFKNSVKPFTWEIEAAINKKHEDIVGKSIKREGVRKTNGQYHICTSCKLYISKGKMPPMSNQNNLQLLEICDYEELKLTELENSMIALNIIFQKIFKLPKSRWPAMKDKTVNIPIFEKDILSTIESLPRTPTSAGIVPINLKRKLTYKNTHLTQFICVPKILKALETLKKMGNPYYQFIPFLENFEDECREKDLEGFNLVYPEDEIFKEELEEISGCQDLEEENMGNCPNKDEENDNEEKEEEEYQNKDSVKKWQFDYNRSTCFTNNYPEIDYRDDDGERVSVAPGEGKHPSNILREKDWDIKSFPCLLPDGKNSLHTKRDIQLSDQEYFIQRIMNRDLRFACNSAYVFAAVAYIEKKQIEGRKGISFKRGKSSISANGTKSYSLEDPYSVLDNIKNTPRYWQKTRYELNAKLQNLGAFTFFFTLSCADMRWPENFTALLQDQTFIYEEVNFKEEAFVVLGDKKEPLMDYLSRNSSKHDFIKQNLLNATLTFHQRVKMFVRHIIMNKQNPMCIKYNSYKVEFALRGAGHIHGVLWMDWNNFSFDKAYEEDEEAEISVSDGFESTNCGETLAEAFEKIRNEEMLDFKDKKAIAKFSDLFITCSLKNPKTRDIVKEVQIHHHTKACRKYCPVCRFYFPRFPSLHTIVSVPFHKIPGSKEEQEVKLQNSKEVLTKVSCVLENDEWMDELIKADEDQINNYIDIKYAILIVNDWLKNGRKERNDVDAKVMNMIKRHTRFEYKDIFLNNERLENILDDLKVAKNLINIKVIERRRLEKLLEKAGIESEEGKSPLEIYEEALSISKNGYKIIHKRDIDECYVNNYNTEWIQSWNANMDLQLCLDYYAVITYISDYYSKDDSGTMGFIKDALKKAENESLQTKLSIVVHQFLTHRQIGESEAFFRILPHLQMKSSNIDTVFIPTGFKANRSSFLKELTKEEAKYCQNVIKIDNKEGFFTEKPSLLDKFERKDMTYNEHIEKLSYLQFGMKYTSSNTEPKEEELLSYVLYKGESGWSITDEMDLIVTHDFEVTKEHHTLPKVIKLKDPRPGEPKYMRKRSRQVVRFHKINSTKYPHEYKYSQLQLFSPFDREEDLGPEDIDRCEFLFNARSEYNNRLKIHNVKKILMKHLESVEAGTERAHDIMNEVIEDMLDPALAQENEDCAEEELIDHPDFLHKDPRHLDKSQHEKRKFKPIELYEEQTLETMTRNLDKDQRIVVEIGVDVARSIVKARHSKAMKVIHELLVIQGGAGTGKSAVINILSQQIERILRSPGDNPDHPYVIKTAFTGTAAANIKGQTLHSTFSFSFGNEFFSLGDKARDELRDQLENLKILIIDEFSFIKADMLYLLDMRLREVKQVSDVAFGGISVFLFGDILQLRPVKAKYIFEEPTSEKFKLVFSISSLWKKFRVILLRTNHRQGEDREYAEVLNRIRLANFTEDDVKTLETRIRKLNDPDIPRSALVVSCTNKEVNCINEDRLSTVKGKEYVIEAITKRNTQKNFKPRTDASGAISGTTLQKILKLKVGAKVVLTFNLDTCDCLTNGAFGEVVGFKFNKDGSIIQIYVHFFDEDCGKETRKNFTELQTKYPGKNVLPISYLEYQYSTSKKSTGGNNNATAIQFPLRLAFASTAHKVQGVTVKKPNSLVVDLRTVREPAQAYVILSRVQSLNQLFILESVCPQKINSSLVAMEELRRMEETAINRTDMKEESVVSCNIRSIKKNFPSFISGSAAQKASVMCLQETWLHPNSEEVDMLPNSKWKQHNNSVGRGKGITTLFTERYTWEKDITKKDYQITKIVADNLAIINVYRSDCADDDIFMEDLFELFDTRKQTLIVGDLNLCFLKEGSNRLFKSFLDKGFTQIVKNPTSLKGRLIDLAFISPSYSDVSYVARQQSQFFTDHDLIEVITGSFQL